MKNVCKLKTFRDTNIGCSKKYIVFSSFLVLTIFLELPVYVPLCTIVCLVEIKAWFLIISIVGVSVTMFLVGGAEPGLAPPRRLCQTDMRHTG